MLASSSRTRNLFIGEFRGRDDIFKTLQTIQLNQFAKTAQSVHF
jgi:hypothetical protein